MDASANYLHTYYSNVLRKPEVLALCGAHRRDLPYSESIDDDLTVVINGYARPEYLPLIWEAVQYQTRRPRETWVVQNDPEGRAQKPAKFLAQIRERADTRVFDADLNLGCWFRFLLAALYCRTRYLIVLDDDTLPGRDSFVTVLAELEARPGLYGGRGLTIRHSPAGPDYWNHDVAGWHVGTPRTTPVDFVGHLWALETYWLPSLFAYLPMDLLRSPAPGRECGEELFISFVAQQAGLGSWVYPHGLPYNARWSSLQGLEMGGHSAALSMTDGLSRADHYLQHFVGRGWQLLNYANALEVGSRPARG